MSRMITYDNIVGPMMNDEEVGYCVSQYGLAESMVRSMSDQEWMDFFGCTQAELPWFLINEDRWEEVEYAIEDATIAGVDLDDELWSDDLLFPLGEADIEAEQQAFWDSLVLPELKNPSLALVPSGKYGVYTPASRKAKPSKPAGPPPHYFVVVR